MKNWVNRLTNPTPFIVDYYMHMYNEELSEQADKPPYIEVEAGLKMAMMQIKKIKKFGRLWLRNFIKNIIQ